MKIKFNIVGLSHGAKKQSLMEYAHQAKGKRLALVMDNQNEFDPIAVAVNDGCERIGYVAAQDSEEVRAAMVASGRKMLLATCKEWGTKDGSEQGLYLTAEACFDAKMSIEQAYAQVYDDSRFVCWEYSGPTYCISQLSDIDSNTDMLEELLADVQREKSQREKSLREKSLRGENAQESSQQGENAQDSSLLGENAQEESLSEEMSLMIQGVLANFLKNHCFDYSREMRRTRRRICELLSGIVGDFPREKNDFSSGGKNESGVSEQVSESNTACRESESEASAPVAGADALTQGLKALLSDMGFITSSSYRERAARCFFIDTPRTLLQNHTGAYDYSDRIDEIERQLEAFPDNLYSYFRADPVDFLRRIFYRRVPRKQMVQLLSGIILMIQNGRVEEVKQWGKHGDRESLEAMKCLGSRKQMDATIRAAIVDDCLVEISKKTYKNSYAPMIKYQADWYPIYRMLQEIGEYGKGEEERFCKRMASLKEKPGLKGNPCKRKDLTQAADDIFENKNASEWRKISQEELRKSNVQDSKFNRYCNIIERFQALLKEGFSNRGFDFEEFCQ